MDPIEIENLHYSNTWINRIIIVVLCKIFVIDILKNCGLIDINKRKKGSKKMKGIILAGGS